MPVVRSLIAWLRAPTAVALLLTGLVLPACTCPRLVERWDSPEATLAQWQARLCRDEVQGEYACLAASFQRTFGGFENYYAARAALLTDQPGAGWVFKHADLSGAALPTDYDADGAHARIVLQARDETLAIDFECEAWVTVGYADGSSRTTRQRAAPAVLVGVRNGQQWLSFDKPVLDAERLAEVRSVHVDPRWLIADIQGLSTHSSRVSP